MSSYSEVELLRMILPYFSCIAPRFWFLKPKPVSKTSSTLYSKPHTDSLIYIILLISRGSFLFFEYSFCGTLSLFYYCATLTCLQDTSNQNFCEVCFSPCTVSISSESLIKWLLFVSFWFLCFMFQTFLKYLEILTGLFKFKSETLTVD